MDHWLICYSLLILVGFTVAFSSGKLQLCIRLLGVNYTVRNSLSPSFLLLSLCYHPAASLTVRFLPAAHLNVHLNTKPPFKKKSHEQAKEEAAHSLKVESLERKQQPERKWSQVGVVFAEWDSLKQSSFSSSAWKAVEAAFPPLKAEWCESVPLDISHLVSFISLPVFLMSLILHISSVVWNSKC